MKLAACYNAFNGTELLEGSVQQIRDQVDELIIVMNVVSNYGEAIKVEDAERIHHVAEKHKGSLIMFSPERDMPATHNSRVRVDKRIVEARRLKCDYFFLSAEDHYYDPEEFAKAKRYIEDHPDIDVSLTKMYTYYKKPQWQLDIIEDYFMPLFMKIGRYTKPSVSPYPYRTDPAVRIEPVERFHVFDESEIMMHHFSMVRKDMESKLRNAQAKGNWKHNHLEQFKRYSIDSNEGIKYFKGARVKEVENRFKIYV